MAMAQRIAIESIRRELFARFTIEMLTKRSRRGNPVRSGQAYTKMSGRGWGRFAVRLGFGFGAELGFTVFGTLGSVETFRRLLEQPRNKSLDAASLLP